MFDFLKKKRFNTDMRDTFIKIGLSLPKEYAFIYHQVKEGIVLSVKKQGNNYYKCLVDNSLFGKYEDKLGRYYTIKKILLSNNKAKTLVTLTIGYGLLLGYTIEDDRFFSDQIEVDISNIEIDFLEENDKLSLFSEEEKKHIAPNDIYEVKLNGCLYYHIQDIEGGNGDFIGIDEEKNVYIITHDPLEIKKQTESLLTLIGIV